MKHTQYLILICIFMLSTLSANAAPVGNIGDDALWSLGLLQKSNDVSFIASISIDNQVNKLPDQIRRPQWTNPDGPDELRFYKQTRKSKNTLNTYGTQIGMLLNDNSIVYVILGMCNASIELRYEDWTVGAPDRSFAVENTFTSGPDLYYGCGATIIMHRGEIMKNVPMTIGMDLKYRRFSIDDDQIRTSGISYKADLDELQIAFSISTKLDFCSPYIGTKVASITGNESYINKNYKTKFYPNEYIEYSDNINWSKNIGYFFGATTYFMGMFSVGIEFRGGDERGVELYSTTRF